MKAVCHFYIRHIHAIGALMNIIPVVAFYAYVFMNLPFREVYVLRVLLSLVLGSAVAALANSFSVNNWLARVKTRNTRDGFLIGSANGFFAGIGTTALSPLFTLISSNSIEEAKTIIIASWIIGAFIGALLGGLLGIIGSKYLYD